MMDEHLRLLTGMLTGFYDFHALITSTLKYHHPETKLSSQEYNSDEPTVTALIFGSQ